MAGNSAITYSNQLVYCYTTVQWSMQAVLPMPSVKWIIILIKVFGVSKYMI